MRSDPPRRQQLFLNFFKIFFPLVAAGVSAGKSAGFSKRELRGRLDLSQAPAPGARRVPRPIGATRLIGFAVA
jgi:hypothetical protein